MKKHILVLLLLVTHSSIWSQSIFQVSGLVKEADDNPLLYANVALSSAIDQSKIYGTSTNDDGVFVLSVPKGRYTMDISYLGYEKYTSLIEVTNDVRIPEIILQQQSTLIKEVVISASSLTYKPDGHILHVQRNPLLKNYSMERILKLTPGAYATSEGVTLYGNSISKIYLNDREVRLSGNELMQYLNTLNGRNIKEIEFVGSSGVEVEASAAGASIMKITTVNVDDGGRFSGSLRTNNGSSTHFLIPSANAQWRKGKWSAYTIGTVVGGKSSQSDKQRTDFYDSGITKTTVRRTESETPGNVLLTIGTAYDINAKNLISFEGFFRTIRKIYDRDRTTTQTATGQNNTVPVSIGISDEKNKTKTFNLSLNYISTLKKDSRLVFKLDRFYNDNKEIYHNNYFYNAGDDVKYDNDYKNESTVYTMEGKLEHSFSKIHKLVTGMRLSHIVNESNTDYDYRVNEVFDEQLSYTDRFRYTESVYAFFAKYSWNYKKIYANLGVRMEHSRLFPKSYITPEMNEKSDYTDLFPEIGLNYRVNRDKGHHLSLNYSRSIRRPGISNLNPTVIQINEYNYRTGNPLLKPSYRNYYSFRTVLFNKYIIRVGHSHAKDGIIRVGNLLDDGSIYTQPINGIKSQNWNLYLEYPITIGEWAMINLSTRYEFSKREYGSDKNKSSNWDFTFSGTFQLPYGIGLMPDISYSPPRKTLYAKYYSRASSNLYVNKSLLKGKLNLSVLFQDIFSSLGTQWTEYRYTEYFQKSMNTYHDFSIAIGINYFFNWGNKSAKIRRNTSGNASEQGRFNSEE